MNSLWTTVMIILGVLLVIITIINYRNCIKELQRVKDLASPIITVDAVRINQIVPIPPVPTPSDSIPPVVEGKRVENITGENIEIIDVF